MANLAVLDEVMASLAQRGTLGMVGVPSDPTSALSVGLIEMQARGLRFMGIVEGDSDPDRFIPELVDLNLAGRSRSIASSPRCRSPRSTTPSRRRRGVRPSKVVLVHE